MYSKQEIAYLLKSGFSLSEIMQVDGVKPEEPEPEPAPAPASAPAPAPAPVPAPDSNASVLAAIENLTKVIQAGNIRAGGFPAPEGERTADAILASIINPPGYTGKEK